MDFPSKPSGKNKRYPERANRKDITRIWKCLFGVVPFRGGFKGKQENRRTLFCQVPVTAIPRPVPTPGSLRSHSLKPRAAEQRRMRRERLASRLRRRFFSAGCLGLSKVDATGPRSQVPRSQVLDFRCASSRGSQSASAEWFKWRGG